MDGVEKFQAKWKQYQAENFDNFLREFGFDEQICKLALTLNPEVTIDITDGLMTVTTSTEFKTWVMRLRLDPHSQMEHEGVLMNYTAKMDGGKLITSQEPVDKTRNKATVHRELTKEGDLLQTMFIGDVVSTRKFKRI